MVYNALTDDSPNQSVGREASDVGQFLVHGNFFQADNIGFGLHIILLDYFLIAGQLRHRKVELFLLDDFGTLSADLFNQSFFLQQSQSLAHRVAADLVVFCQLMLAGQEVSDCITFLQNIFLNLFEQLFVFLHHKLHLFSFLHTTQKILSKTRAFFNKQLAYIFENDYNYL